MRIVLLLVVVLVVAAGVAWQQTQRPQRALDQQSAALLQQWPHLAPQEVTRIDLHHGDVAVQLLRQSDHWMVMTDSYGAVTANQELVTRLLTDVTAMRPQRVISSNPDHVARFRLSDDSADRLTLRGKDGGLLLDLLIGKPGTDLISTIVRQVGTTMMVNVNRSLGWQLGRSAASWQAVKERQTAHPS